MCHVTIAHNEKLIQKHKDVHKKKLVNLLSYIPEGHSTYHDPEKVVFNFSSLVLTESDKMLLSKGLNFAFPENVIPYEDFMLPYEVFYRGVKNFAKTPEDEINFHARLKNVAVSSFSSFKQQNIDHTNLTQEELESLNKLVKNSDIIIQKADKGNTVVICDKNAYVERMKELINDDSKFVDLHKEPSEWLNHIVRSEERVRKVLYKYCETNTKHTQFVFTDRQYASVAPTGSKPGTLYGLPKIHKTLVNNLPKFRPIVSMIGTPTYKLSKFLVPFITPITTNEYTVKDSFAFAKEVLEYDSNLFMSSLDVTSLFTNIPLKETTDIICNELFKDQECIGGMNKRTFRELLTLAMEETCFIFDGKLYKQCDGVSMGSPLGPDYANSFMSYHEKIWLADCPDDIKPITYRRYVDDIFVLCRDREHHEKFKEYMNSKHENISFTDELEEKNMLAFLDVAVTRTDDGFTTNLYRKGTFSGVFTNFFSFLSIQFKSCLISTLLFRCYQLTSTSQAFHKEVERLRGILAKNSYPLEFVDQCITAFLNKCHKKPRHTVEKRSQVIVLPYLGKLSLEIRSRLKKYVSKHISNVKLMIIFRSQRRLKTLFKFKDSLPDELQSFIVYKFTCGACNSSYVGKTDRHRHIRWCEHLKLQPFRGGPSKSKQKPTSVEIHKTTTGHETLYENFEVIGREKSRNTFFLKIKESLLIKKLAPSLNDQDSSIPLSLFK